jgi:hypothetical protein
MSLKKRIKKITQTITKPLGSAAETATKVFNDPIGASGDILSGQLNALTLGQSGRLMRNLASARGAENAEAAAADAAAATEQQKLDALSTDALNKYKSGQINPDLQATIDERSRIRKAQTAQQFGGLGLGDSTAKLSTDRLVDQARTTEVNAALDQEFQKSMQVLGLEKQAADIVYQMRKEDQQASAAAFASTMQALGTVAMIAVMA